MRAIRAIDDDFCRQAGITHALAHARIAAASGAEALVLGIHASVLSAGP